MVIFSIFIFISCENHKSNSTTSTINKVEIDTTQKSIHRNEHIFDNLDYNTLLSRLFDKPEFDSTETAIWKPCYYERMTLPVSLDGKCHTNIDTIMYFTDREKRKCACVILTTYNYRKGNLNEPDKIAIGDCHFCGVPIGVALLAETKSKKWHLYKFEKAFTSLGYFGTYRTSRNDAGKISLLEIGDKWTCLSLKQGVGGNGGYLSGTISLYSIEEFHLNGFPNQALTNLLSYNFYYSDVDAMGDNDTRTLEEKRDETTIAKIIKQEHNYYDIELITKSNHFSTTKHYKFSDIYNQFVEQ